MNDNISFQATGKNGIETMDWNPSETAAIIMDMWDQHWCKGAAERINEMAPAMNKFLDFLRNKGIKKIIHCPTDVTNYYKNSYARIQTKKYPNSKIMIPSVSLPSIRDIIDPYTVQCDCSPKCDRTNLPWTKECEQITILGKSPQETEQYDLICEEYEWYLFHALEALGIKNIFVMGIHANMGMIYRRHAIKNLKALKYNLVMVGNLTDCMAPREEMPYKNHFDVLDDTLDFIKKNICPVANTRDITEDTIKFPGFQSDKRHGVLLPGTGEYKFNQAEDQKKSLHKLPVGVSYEISNNGYFKKLNFIYEYENRDQFPNDTARKEIGIYNFQLGTYVDGLVVYYKKDKLGQKILGIKLKIKSDLATVKPEISIGTCSTKYKSNTFTAVDGMSIASFSGGYDNQKDISYLACDCISPTYFVEQPLGRDEYTLKRGFYCKDWDGRLCAVECIGGKFWVYPDRSTADVKPSDELKYKTVNHTNWRCTMKGICFSHYYVTNRVPNHKCGIIGVLDENDNPFLITVSNEKGEMYIPKDEQQTSYDVNKPIPYYERTSIIYSV